MKKIRVTTITAATEEYPGCADILGSFPELEIIACHDDLNDTTAWSAIERSDVLIFDEAALAQAGVAALRAMQHTHPLLKLLLVVDKYIENNVIEAITAGFSGVVERSGLCSELRRAIPALYSGEAWIPRRIAQTLRYRLLAREGEAPAGTRKDQRGLSEKFN